MVEMSISRVIDGKRYDTEKAKCVGVIVDQGHSGDFRQEKTAIFISARGQWFVAGWGGALSRWQTRTCDGLGHGSGLELLTPEEARKLLEKHDLDVEAYFEVEEG